MPSAIHVAVLAAVAFVLILVAVRLASDWAIRTGIENQERQVIEAPVLDYPDVEFVPFEPYEP